MLQPNNLKGSGFLDKAVLRQLENIYFLTQANLKEADDTIDTAHQSKLRCAQLKREFEKTYGAGNSTKLGTDLKLATARCKKVCEDRIPVLNEFIEAKKNLDDFITESLGIKEKATINIFLDRSARNHIIVRFAREVEGSSIKKYICHKLTMTGITVSVTES